MIQNFRSSLLLVLMLCVVATHAAQNETYLEIKNKMLTVRQDLTRGGAICFVGRKGQASAVVLNQEKAKEMGFLHCEVEDE